MPTFREYLVKNMQFITEEENTLANQDALTTSSTSVTPTTKKVQKFLKILERYGRTLGVAINGGTIIVDPDETKGFSQIRYNLKSTNTPKIQQLTFSNGQKLASRN